MRIAIVLLLVLLSGNCAAAQSRGSLGMKPIRHLRKGVDAWPLIAHASSPAEKNANATLNRLNERMVKTLTDCDVSYRDWAKQVDQSLTGKNAIEGDWQRKIRVTMTGPRYVSIVAIDSVFCGGAHPDGDTFALVFDLTTGKLVNWMTLMAESADVSVYSDSNSDGTTVDALIIPALRPLTIMHASAECKDVFQNPQPYQLWPDAKSGTLTAKPFGLPHVVAACADDLKLTLDQARKLGFSETLLSAIARAHRQLAPRVP